MTTQILETTSVPILASCCCLTTVLIVSSLVLFLCFLKCCCRSNRKISGLEHRLVVITGCDTGFGNMLAKELDKQGIPVIAGCITSSGIDELQRSCSSKLKAVLCDVTKPEHIEELVNVVNKLPDPVWAVVNNAGIAITGPFDLQTLGNIQKVMEVNYFGGVRMCKAFMPMMKKSKGRFINVTSTAGLVGAPTMIPYSSSKFAFKGFTEGLRRELKPWGIQVITVEPYFMKTAIVTNAEEQTRAQYARAPPEIKAEYTEEWLEEYIAKQKEKVASAADPMIVVRDMEKAITALNPQPLYHPGSGSKIAYFMYCIMPESFWDWAFCYSSSWYPHHKLDKQKKQN